MILQSARIPFAPAPRRRVRRVLVLLLSLPSLFGLIFAGGLPTVAHGQGIDPGWLSVNRWKVKMSLTQILNKQGLLQSGETCSFNYTLALNHTSDVTGQLDSTDTGGAWQGSLASTEDVNNTLTIIGSGDPNCVQGNTYFTEVCTGSGSEENVSFSIDSTTGKYTVSFPHTGIDCPVTYQGGMYGYWSGTLRKEINGEFLPDYPSMVLSTAAADPVTTLELALPAGPPQKITGETTFQHWQHPEIPVTWSWELMPDAGEPEVDLGCPDGKCKANGGTSAPGSGYGVPVWSVNMANLNLFITDTPLWHRSPIGPPMELTVSYNSKSTTARFESVGRRWQLNYESYLSADIITGDVTIYMPDGRRDVYKYATGTYTPPYRVFNELRKLTDEHYELLFPDGTLYTYKVPTGSYCWAFLTEVRDPHGLKLTLFWDGKFPWGGILRTMFDAAGRSITFSYDGNDRLITAQGPFGRTARFEYDSSGNLKKITDVGGYSTTFTYDASGNMSSMVQGSNTWDFIADATGLTVRNNLGSEKFTQSSYQGSNALGSDGAGDGAGSIPTYAYTQTPAADGKNKDVTAFQTPEGVGFKFTYDARGNQLTDTLQALEGDQTSTFTYNAKGKVTSVKDKKGNLTTLEYYSNFVDLKTLTDGLGAISATYWPGTHDIQTLTDRLGYTKTFAYNTLGQVAQAIDGLGIVTEYVYSGDHQLIRITRAGAVVASYIYDNFGRINTYTDANGYTRSYAYNSIDDLLSVTYPDGTVARYTYSTTVPHQLASMTDTAGRTTRLTYNGYKQLQELTDPSGGITRYVYDRDGNVKELEDPLGNTTRFEYDKDNRLTKKTFADGKFVSFTYTKGRLTRFTNARGITTDYTYDASGNVLTINYSDGTPDVTITYDPFNRPITITDGLGTHIKTYDAASRVTSIDGPWANDTLTFGYDQRGRRTSLAVQGGSSVTYAYDALDRLTSVTTGGLTYTYAYRSGTSLLERIGRSDGSGTEYGYDGMNRLQQLTNRDRAGGLLNQYVFAFDALGQPTAETVSNGPALSAAALVTTAYTYNNLNQTATVGGSGTNIAFDDDGNMIKGLTGDGRPFTATYDAESRLTSIQYTDGAGVVQRQEFVYGSDGFLGIQKFFANASLVAEKRYVRFAGRPLQERNGANAVTADYIWGLAQEGGVGALLALVRGGQMYQYYANPRGDITAVLDGSGAVAATYAYDAFGLPLAASESLNQPMRFSTKAYDEGTGLYYYGYRFYSPRLGRWLTRDPRSERGSLNLYSFTGGNPIARFDPLGAQDADFSWMRPEDQAKAQAMLAERRAADEASRSGWGTRISEGLSGAFKWIGDKVKENPEATKKVVDTVVDKALDANEYTKTGKEINEKINKGIEIAEDVAEIEAAYKDKDPASGLTLLKNVVKYTCGRIPIVGDAVSEVMTKGIETVETAPGGVQAFRNAGRQAAQIR